MKFFSNLFTFYVTLYAVGLTFCVLHGCLESSSGKERSYKEIPTHRDGWGGINGGFIDEYQRDHTTYLIFHRGEGIFVVNYTQDSLDYEFLHQSTR